MVRSLISNSVTVASLFLLASSSLVSSEIVGAGVGGDSEYQEVPLKSEEDEYNQLGQRTYFVDVSYPIWSNKLSNNYDWLPHNNDTEDCPEEFKDMPVQRMGNKQEFYDQLMQGCRDKFGRSCDNVEDDRFEMSYRQPQSMRNYTKLGFKKIKAPEAVFELLKEFWEENYMNESPEKWSRGYTYVNHWSSPTTMVSVEDTGMHGGGEVLKAMLWDAAQSTMEEWTGQDLAPCSLYGIRVYKEGAVLATHVDRLPLVTSAIINVAQDVDEDWPVEVYGHDGKAYNITMEPGDMVLYESHSVLHGRPFPLKGRYYANVFVHFEPVGPKEGHCGPEHFCDSVPEGDLPPYLLPGSPEEGNWRMHHPNGWEPLALGLSKDDGSNAAHSAAAAGDIVSLEKLKRLKPEDLTAEDDNGWRPIHEAARSGHVSALEFLLEHGEDVNARAGGHSTPLNLAKAALGSDHEVCDFLRNAGGKHN